MADAAFGSSESAPTTQFSVDGADDGPVLVDGYSDSLHRALANLLTNVQEHAPGAYDVVSVAVVGAEAVISVADDGPGMPPHVAANAFDRFFRGRPNEGLRRR